MVHTERNQLQQDVNNENDEQLAAASMMLQTRGGWRRNLLHDAPNELSSRQTGSDKPSPPQLFFVIRPQTRPVTRLHQLGFNGRRAAWKRQPQIALDRN